ncbi:MAG TPA: undecaprenyldiphospho-muramoylpentapeptide beta-N-acetylglucosaminyltransferase [Vicinamibacterales bacterium]|nr:undecaprenyldiphospho-muramoylpentapeptide beta-N-acetylglucosaminyltransferase [Vicinamibacterales bacterium]
MTGGPLTIVIAGGGTGGHLYPGLAVARALMARVPDAQVSFAGTSRGLEARVVPEAGFELDVIRSRGLKGKSIANRLRGAALLPAGLLDAWRLLSRRRPHVVVGVGGYSSGPVVLLASLRGMATMVLEQNAVPGLTNRWLAPFVRAAAVNYERTLEHFGGKGFVSGNPVRAEFVGAGSDAARAPHPPQVLIVGGSQGAHAINVAMTAAAPELMRQCPGVEIVHQTGARDREWVQAQYDAAGIGARVVAFLDAMADKMTAADVVVSRAGATTLAELAALGRPAIFIPLPTATDDHQRKNAQVLVDLGAAKLVDERVLNQPEGPVTLAGTIAGLVGDEAGRAAMSTAMRAAARPGAADAIVSRILELAA